MTNTATNINLDDHVDDEIAACLNIMQPTSFFMFAGAGSGKTRSLVKALKHVRNAHGSQLKMRGQSVAVITYTNAACDEILRRLDNDPLFHVSTIHSFAWSLIKGFSHDIREWLRINLADNIAELVKAEEKGRPGTKASQARQSQIVSKTERLQRLDEFKKFTYNPNGDNRERDSLSHSEVIKITADFLISKPLMQRIVTTQFPFLLVDESQDTNKHLIEAIMVLAEAHKEKFSVGLLGDVMQRIYSDGKENIERDLPADWAKPEKKLNHRCPRRVVELINKVRSDVDTHKQIARSDAKEGLVRFFILSSDTANKPEAEMAVMRTMAIAAMDDKWLSRDTCKILTLEHHMSALRMGFATIFDSLNKIESFYTGLLDGTLPILRFFTQCILPVVTAEQVNKKFATATIVRAMSPLLDKAALRGAEHPQTQLRLANDAVNSLMELWSNNRMPTCRQVLAEVARTGLFSIPDSLKPVLAIEIETVTEEDEEDPLSERFQAITNALEAPFSEIGPYNNYVTDNAPYDTHQGVKGLEFERVMVLIDDAEARGFMFKYDKLLGIAEKSETDRNNEAAGNDSAIDRARRLFYVTCSRAQGSLALVYYASDPAAVRNQLLREGWFTEKEIILGTGQ